MVQFSTDSFTDHSQSHRTFLCKTRGCSWYGTPNDVLGSDLQEVSHWTVRDDSSGYFHNSFGRSTLSRVTLFIRVPKGDTFRIVPTSPSSYFCVLYWSCTSWWVLWPRLVMYIRAPSVFRSPYSGVVSGCRDKSYTFVSSVSLRRVVSWTLSYPGHWGVTSVV